MANSTEKISAVSLCILLAACGGGSSNSGTTNASGATQGSAGTGTTPAATGGTTTGSTTPAGTGSGTSTDTGAGGNTGSTSGTGTSTPPAGSTGSGGASGGGDGTPSPTPTDTGGSTGSTGGTSNGSTGSGSTTGSGFAVDQTARFNSPGDITVDSAGNLHVMDRGNLAVRRIDTSGNVTTLPGSYAADTRLALNGSNVLYALSGGALSRVAADGSRTTLWTATSGPGQYTPVRIAADAQGRAYVLQQYRNQFRVDRLNPDNSLQQGLYAFSTEGETIDFAVNGAGGIAVGTIGPVAGTSRITYVAPGVQPATASTAGLATWQVALNNVGKMSFDASGNLYVADASYTYTEATATSPAHYTVSGMRVQKIAPDGTAATVLSGFPDGSTASRATSLLKNSMGIAADAGGAVYLTDPFVNAVYKLSGGTATLIAGKPGEAGNSD